MSECGQREPWGQNGDIIGDFVERAGGYISFWCPFMKGARPLKSIVLFPNADERAIGQPRYV